MKALANNSLCHQCFHLLNPLALNELQLIFRRQIFRLPFKPPSPTSLFTSKKKSYNERRALGYSMDQVYDVVSRVDDYYKFVPACTKSVVTRRSQGNLEADLEIGIPPLIWEKYKSKVTLIKPHLVKAECVDGILFNYLETRWKFSDGPDPANEHNCILDFAIDFEFRSQLHSQMVHVFFDEMVRQTVKAFLKRTEKLYGKQKAITYPNMSTSPLKRCH